MGNGDDLFIFSHPFFFPLFLLFFVDGEIYCLCMKVVVFVKNPKQ